MIIVLRTGAFTFRVRMNLTMRKNEYGVQNIKVKTFNYF